MTIRRQRVDLGVLSNLPRLDVASRPAANRTEALRSDVAFGVNTFDKAIREFERRGVVPKPKARRSLIQGIVDAFSNAGARTRGTSRPNRMTAGHES